MSDDETNIFDFTGVTVADIEPDQVLETAKGMMETAILVGWDTSGELYFASSTSNMPDIVYLLESAKQECWRLEEE